MSLKDTREKLSEQATKMFPDRISYKTIQENENFVFKIVSDDLFMCEEGEGDILERVARYDQRQLLVIDMCEGSETYGKTFALNCHFYLAKGILDIGTEMDLDTLKGMVFNVTRTGTSWYDPIDLVRIENEEEEDTIKEDSTTEDLSTEEIEGVALSHIKTINGTPRDSESLAFFLGMNIGCDNIECKKIVDSLMKKNKIEFKDNKVYIVED